MPGYLFLVAFWEKVHGVLTQCFYTDDGYGATMFTDESKARTVMYQLQACGKHAYLLVSKGGECNA